MSKTVADLQSLADAKSPALQQRHYVIPTPEEQLAQVLNTPGVTPADVDFAKNWAAQETANRKTFGLEWVEKTRAGCEERAREVKAAMFEDREQMIGLSKEIARGDFPDSESIFKAAHAYRDRIISYERAIAALETTEELIAKVEESPESWFYSFYGKYGVLAERIPTLAQALYARHSR